MLNFTPAKRNFDEESEFVKSIYERSWSRMGKQESMDMIYDEQYTSPTDHWTYGESIIIAINKHFEEEKDS